MDILEFLDGKEYTYEGIHGHFKLERPFLAWSDRLYHIPSEQGKNSKEYLEIERQLGDDWTTDLTNNIETYIEIAHGLGYFNIENWAIKAAIDATSRTIELAKISDKNRLISRIEHHRYRRSRPS